MRRVLLLAVAACAVISLTGCMTIRKAEHVEVQVLDDRVVLVKPANGLQRGGETVLKIMNFGQSPVNMVLAETTAVPTAIPASLVDAVSPRDDDRIVAMTSRVDKAGVSLSFGFPAPAPKVVSLHVYLKPGKRYLLFDKLGGYAHGVALTLVPPRSR
jgi:hypothetical protein